MKKSALKISNSNRPVTADNISHPVGRGSPFLFPGSEVVTMSANTGSDKLFMWLDWNKNELMNFSVNQFTYAISLLTLERLSKYRHQ